MSRRLGYLCVGFRWLIERQSKMTATPLSKIEQSILVSAYFRGGDPDDGDSWGSNCDQVITLSLFYTGDISFDECAERFSQRPYLGGLYNDDGKLTDSLRLRYSVLTDLIRTHSRLIEGEGDLRSPALPTYTSCRLTLLGQQFACSLIPSFPQKPHFPNWPDKR